MAKVAPILLSAIVCCRVIFDKVSGMASVIDILQTINAPKYPARHSNLVFFCEMTNGHGKTGTVIRLIDSRDQNIIFEQKGIVEFKDVKQVIALAMNMQGLVFPRPGEYCFQLFTNDQLLAERRIVCRKIKLPPRDSKGQA